MLPLRNHILLIGFKHVGKSVIGKVLAEKLSVFHLDLDNRIEFFYEKKWHEKLTCRAIMEKKGEPFFRSLETDTLRAIMDSAPSVISTGGGTPLFSDNQKIMQSGTLVHIQAPKEIVYERIQKTGRPAFFNPEDDLLNAFNALWEKRLAIYQEISDFSIVNEGSVDDVGHGIIQQLNRYEGSKHD
ncbi:MAG TPA: shikimate kinase [Gammaproteobacteria bacterium]|nr:shikimate kinase [Gammaproteobacteria bacterium]